MHVCLWLHLPAKAASWVSDSQTAAIGNVWNCTLRASTTRFFSVQEQYKTGSCLSGCVSERRPFLEKAASCLFGIFLLWIKLLGTGEHLCPAGFLPSRIIKQDQRHLQTSWSPNSTDLYSWYLLDDQHRNTNMNDKDHLVGQLTTFRPDVSQNQENLFH